MARMDQLLGDELLTLFSHVAGVRHDDDEQLICVRLTVQDTNAFLKELAQKRESLIRRIDSNLQGECMLEVINQFRDGDKSVYMIFRRVPFE
jgi:hypothetical protein